MTALKQYQRLESIGLWKVSGSEQQREVLVAFGDATLVMSDGDGLPLTHWSLSTVHRLNEGSEPAVFAPAQDAPETLEIHDQEMIDAIEKVRKTIEKGRSRPGRLRWVFWLGLPLAIIAGCLTYGPDLLNQQTARLVPQVKRDAFGADILATLESELGPRCDGQRGSAVLSVLSQRLLGTDAGLVVLPEGFGLAVGLPGQIIAIDQTVIEKATDPHVVAGHILAADAQRRSSDPLVPLLRAAGPRPTFRLLATSELEAQAIEKYTQKLLSEERSFPPIADLKMIFDQANIPSGPFFKTQGIDLGEQPSPPKQPTLNDSEWVTLQGICLQ